MQHAPLFKIAGETEMVSYDDLVRDTEKALAAAAGSRPGWLLKESWRERRARAWLGERLPTSLARLEVVAHDLGDPAAPEPASAYGSDEDRLKDAIITHVITSLRMSRIQADYAALQDPTGII